MTDEILLAYLETREEGKTPARLLVTPLPFRIGRGDGLGMPLPSAQVSKVHAEIVRKDGGFELADLGSRNGTFVNGERLQGRALLSHGDVIHIADVELLFILEDPPRDGSENLDATAASTGAIHDEVVRSRDLHRILEEKLLAIVFQSVVELSTGTVRGYEALGRSTLRASVYPPGQLFEMAERRGKEVELSRILRRRAVEQARTLPKDTLVFLNVHPAEMGPSLLGAPIDELAPLVEQGLRPVLEIHETAVTDLEWMSRARRELAARGIRIAYDDFGAGRSRLMELAEAPPDIIKLDMSLVRDIDKAPNRQDLVRALVQVMRGVGVTVLAEGLETESEASVCLDLGCTLGQGFLYGMPAPVPPDAGLGTLHT